MVRLFMSNCDRLIFDIIINLWTVFYSKGFAFVDILSPTIYKKLLSKIIPLCFASDAVGWDIIVDHIVQKFYKSSRAISQQS